MMKIGGQREVNKLDNYKDPLVQEYFKWSGNDIDSLSEDSIVSIQGDMCRNCNKIAVLKLVKYQETGNLYLLCNSCIKKGYREETDIDTFGYSYKQLHNRCMKSKKKWHGRIYGGMK